MATFRGKVSLSPISFFAGIGPSRPASGDRVWLSKHNSTAIAEHRARSDAHPSEGDNFAVGGRRWVRTCTPGTAHNLARCGYFRRFPPCLLVRGRLATGVPINFGARELRKHVVRQADHFASDTLETIRCA